MYAAVHGDVPSAAPGVRRRGRWAPEALDVVLLMLLENLIPTERAAYLLREAFD